MWKPARNFSKSSHSFDPHLILSDYQLPHFDGFSALLLAVERRPEIPFILVTGSLNEETAVDCMKAGAWDYILKDRLRLLGPAVLDVLEKKRLREEHRRAADELRKSEEQYRLLVESTEAIAWEYSIAEDRWTYIAPQGEKVLGYACSEFTDFAFWMANLHPEDRQWASTYCAEHTERGENHTFEYRFRKKDGEYVWLRDVVSVERENGKPETLRGYMLDITRSRQAQELLQESEERHRSLFENSHAIMLLVDPADGSIVDANPAAVAFYGWSQDELCQKKIFSINTLSPQELQIILDRLRAVPSQRFEFQHRLADGTVHPVEVFCRPYHYFRQASHLLDHL